MSSESEIALTDDIALAWQRTDIDWNLLSDKPGICQRDNVALTGHEAWFRIV